MISATTSIHHLGLDSISAVQIAASLREHDHNIKASDVLKYTTCAEIATFLGEQPTRPLSQAENFDFQAFEHKYKASILGMHAIDDGAVEAIRPCTHLQNGIISKFLVSKGAMYLNYLRLRLHSNVDVEKLKEAWTRVMERHAILRTGFAHIKDTHYPFAMIQYAPKAISLPWNITSNEDSSKLVETWLQNLQRATLTNFHLPPWQIQAIKCNKYTNLDIGIFHGLFDAQSLQLIFHDVSASYNTQHMFPRTPTSIDPTINSLLNLRKQSFTKAKKFWIRLGKNANPCRFPHLAPLRYKPRPPAVQIRVSAKRLPELARGCREANISLQTAGIAAWLKILSGYTGEPSVTCGVVLSSRSFEGSEHAVFPCLNTVPFACVVPLDKRTLLDKVTLLNAEIHRHQHTPLQDAQRLMGFPNEPLFDSIFAYQKLPYQNGESEFWSVVHEKAVAEYPVSIEMVPNRGHMEYRLTFLPHIVPKEQACLMLDQFDELMENLIFPELLSEAQSSCNPKLYSVTAAKQPMLPSEARLLHEMVEITAMKYSKRVAFEFADTIDESGYSSKSWTYAELDGEGNRIAHLLVSHCVAPGELVGICFEKCPEASFAMLGILKAGCAFVAIDPAAPVARQAFIIKDSQVRIILSMSPLSSRFKEGIEVPVVNLDEVATRSLPRSKPMPVRDVSPRDRSYCLYTSGTTGTPKGCELTHENAVQAILAFQRLFAGHWDVKSRWLQFASFHFDVSVLEQYWSWSVGICVVSAPRDLIFEDIAKAIRALEITHLDLTPSLAQLLHPDDVPSLCRGIFITGGESLKQEILDVWGPTHVIYNGYGPTETTIGVTMYPRVPVNGRPSNIGRQFDNVGTFILKPDSTVPVLRGGVGELCISGKLVGKGYLNRAELTDERFPYLEEFNERVYRTGDLVRILHDGSFDFIGRTDDQIKLRGQRLEVTEINSVIKQCTQGISDVATLVLKHPEQQKEQLVAFIVTSRTLRNEPKVLFEDVLYTESAKEGCRAKLPPYMIPTHFVPLSNMPLNINNKADRKKLREIYDTLSGRDLQLLSFTSSRHGGTWSKPELKLREVLSDALSVREESLDKNTSFFQVGMDSISVIGVSRRLKHAGFMNATASMILQHSSIHLLVKALKVRDSIEKDRTSILAAQQAIIAIQHHHRHAVARSLSVHPSEIESLAPCTPLQYGIIAKYLESENGLYFNSFHFRLNHKGDEKKLRTAWEDVYAATPILRTSFVDTKDGYVQVVLRGKHLRWSWDTVIKNGPEDKGSTQPSRQRRSRTNQTELTQPFRILSVKTPKHKLIVVHIFHGLYDGHSLGLIFKAVWEAYNGKKQPNVAPSFHSALAHGPLRVIVGAKRFWLDHLSNTFSPNFPTLVNEPGDGPVIVERQLRNLTGFESMRRKLNVTAQSIGQACWLSVLQLYSKTGFTTGIVVSGRSINLDGANEIVGPMFNTIPYQHDVRGHETWASIIKSVHEFNTTSHQYQHTPLRNIMKWCNRNSNQPLFNTLFVFKLTQDNEEWTNNEAWDILDNRSVTEYALAFEIEYKANDCFNLLLVTQGHVSNQRTSNDLLDHFEEAVRKILVDPFDVLDMTMAKTSVMHGSQTKPKIVTAPEDRLEFRWKYNACLLREEIAHLCAVETGHITETTSIFELGLDSIDAVKLSSKLKMRGVNLPVSGIMHGLNIAQMELNILDDDAQQDQRSAKVNLDLHKRRLRNCLQKGDSSSSIIEDVLPLTPLQEAMVAEMVSSNYLRYYNHDVLKLNPEIDMAKLRSAWTQVIEASPILRTSFMEIDDPHLEDSFVQIIHQRHQQFWSYSKTDGQPDFTSLFQTLRDDVMKSKMSKIPFSILHIEGKEESYLILSIAHALYDGWSLGLLHSDIWDAYYDQFIPRINYETTLASILSTFDSGVASFWQNFLVGARPSTFPLRLNKLKDEGYGIHRHQQSSRIVVADIMSFVKKNHVSLESLCHTAFAMVLSSYVKSLDVIFGSVFSGRHDGRRSQLLFPLMNTLAMRAILHGSCLEMIYYVQDSLQSIKEWQHVPLRKALSLAGIRGGFLESLFIYQKSAFEKKQETNSLYTSIEGYSDVEYPVCVEMEVVRDELVWRCAAKKEVFDASGVKELLDRLDTVLGRLLSDPELPVIEFRSEGISIGGLPSFDDTAYTSPGTDEAAADPKQDQRNETQSRTAQIIREVLATVSKVSVNEITNETTMFHIGLDSISAIKVSSLLRKQDMVISVGEMLRAETIEKMATIIDSRASVLAGNNQDYKAALKDALQGLDRANLLHLARVQEENVVEILPVTAGQLYMLSIWSNLQGGNFYPEFTYQLPEFVKFEILQQSWQSLAEVNSILKTLFISTGSEQIPYVQIVLRDVKISITDITGLTEDEAVAQIQKIVHKQPWVHLFVSQRLVGWNLRLRIHHSLYDGVSLALLMRQFQDLCDDIVAPISDDSLVQLVARNYTTSALADRESFWTEYLKNTEQQLLSPKFPSGLRTEIFRPGLLRYSSLEANLCQWGVSIHSIFLATYAKLFDIMTNATGNQDVIIGVYLANRSLSISGIESAAIPTVNLVPLRVTRPFKRGCLAIAVEIQRDLQAISDATNAFVNLFEILHWTGVKIDTFVNFLTLPDSEDTGRQDHRNKKMVTRPTNQWQDAVSKVSTIRNGLSEVPCTLVNNRVNGAYLQAIDVEARVQNGGLDIGVFAPTSLLSLKQGEKLVEDLSHDLKSLCSSPMLKY